MVATWSGQQSLNPRSWKHATNIQQWYIDLAGNLRGKQLKGMRSMIMLTIWVLWKERNNRIFKKEERPAERLLTEIRDETTNWKTAGEPNLELIGANTYRE